MESLVELIDRTIAPEAHQPRGLEKELVESRTPVVGTLPYAFEHEVFNFLLDQKSSQGISKLWRCKNARIDGLLDLDDGRRIGLELTYRMNWPKACQACWQIDWYCKQDERPKPDGAIVVFNEFSGDWARGARTRRLANGWNYWYAEHDEVEGIPVHLLRFQGE